jgi:hypothetical protein
MSTAPTFIRDTNRLVRIAVPLLSVLLLKLMISEWPLTGWGACFVLLGIALYLPSTSEPVSGPVSESQ